MVKLVLHSTLLLGAALSWSSRAFEENLSYASPYRTIAALRVAHPYHREVSGVDYDAGHRRVDGETCTLTFAHSVASGDPFDTSVLLWTRVTPSDDLLETVIPITCKVLDAGVEVASIQTHTSIDVDFTVKLIVGSLTPATQYTYYFTSTACSGAPEVQSDIGSTKTLPSDGSALSKLTFSTLSCSLYSYGYFHAYARLAEKSADIDFIVFLGDYIYEYGNYNTTEAYFDPYNKKQAREPIGESHIPNHECISLDDYRQRYAQHRSDPPLQALHKALPWIIIPDDHETADNAWAGGAFNHDSSTEGDWLKRVEGGMRSWFEWTPTRQFVDDPQRSYRKFAVGDLVELIMLSTRYDGREEQINSNFVTPPNATDVALFLGESATKEIMSDYQMEWIDEALHSSTQAWKVLGNQVVLSDIVFPTAPYVIDDSWVGYKGSQSQLFAAMQDVDDIIVLSGDMHLGMSIAGPMRASDAKPIYAEFVTPAVCSAGLGDIVDFLSLEHAPVEAAMFGINQDLKAINIACHGYNIHTFTPTRATSDMYCVDPFTKDSVVDDLVWSLSVCRGTGTIASTADVSC